MQRLTVLLFGLGAILTGCGGDSPTDAITYEYENIAGTYTGTLSGVTQGITLTALSVTIVHSDDTPTRSTPEGPRSDLTGSYSIEGTLEGDFRRIPIEGLGNVVGTISPGQNPEVDITLWPARCSNSPWNAAHSFSGAYDSANRRITATGSLTAIGLAGEDDSCHPLFSMDATVVLNR